MKNTKQNEKVRETGNAIICTNWEEGEECGRLQTVEGLTCGFCTKHFGGCDFQRMSKVTVEEI